MFLEAIVKTVYTAVTIASSYFTTLTDQANIDALFLWHGKCDYVCCLPREMAVYIQWGDCPALFEWVCCILRFLFFLVKDKNKPWEDHTSICRVHKRCVGRLCLTQGGLHACVRACVPPRFCSIYPRLPPGSRTKQKERQGEEKSTRHLYVKSHLLWGEKKNATCRRMSFKKSIKTISRSLFKSFCLCRCLESEEWVRIGGAGKSVGHQCSTSSPGSTSPVVQSDGSKKGQTVKRRWTNWG